MSEQIQNFYSLDYGAEYHFSTTSFPGGNSEWEPPDPISNSEVKTLSADGSVGSPHVRVGHCQDLIENPVGFGQRGFFMRGKSHITHGSNYGGTVSIGPIVFFIT